MVVIHVYAAPFDAEPLKCSLCQWTSPAAGGALLRYAVNCDVCSAWLCPKCYGKQTTKPLLTAVTASSTRHHGLPPFICKLCVLQMLPEVGPKSKMPKDVRSHDLRIIGSTMLTLRGLVEQQPHHHRRVITSLSEPLLVKALVLGSSLRSETPRTFVHLIGPSSTVGAGSSWSAAQDEPWTATTVLTSGTRADLDFIPSLNECRESGPACLNPGQPRARKRSPPPRS